LLALPRPATTLPPHHRPPSQKQTNKPKTNIQTQTLELAEQQDAAEAPLQGGFGKKGYPPAKGGYPQKGKR
jgi:hypothetical protein